MGSIGHFALGAVAGSSVPALPFDCAGIQVLTGFFRAALLVVALMIR